MPTVGTTSKPAYVYDAGTDTWVPVGVGAHTHDYISNTLVNSKGDLITATANDAPAILSLGNSGETLVADSSATTGLRWQASQAAGKNYIINGGFDIWQRGTSFAGPANLSYTTDRWWAWSVSSMAQKTVSRQTGFSNSNYCMRVARTSGQTEVGAIGVGTVIESANMYALQGKTVTVSFDARAGANFSGSGGNLQVLVQAGTGVDQGVGGWWSPGWTGNTTLTGGNVVLTTTATKYSVSFAVPSNSAEMLVGFQWTPTGTAGAADYFEVTNVQLEIGSVATTFTRTGGTLAGELAACQRYYYRLGPGGNNNGPIAMGMFNSAGTGVQAQIMFPTQMRNYPSSIDTANLRAQDISNGYTMTSITLTNLQSKFGAMISASVTGATAFRSCFIDAGSSAGYLAFNAEL